MSNILNINICIIQPNGYFSSLGFLDQADYLRYQMSRLGIKPSLTKNRFKKDSVNFVFGAHLGLPNECLEKYCCIFVNLEQIGKGGSNLSTKYLEILKNYPAVDYDIGNVSYLGKKSIPIISFEFAPYLYKPELLRNFEDRPIDLLFFGALNDRRIGIINLIKEAGVDVSLFNNVVFGPERDEYIRNSKCVLNIHHYEAARFEQARVSHCLSLGTPVISERTPSTNPSPVFENVVNWLDTNQISSFFKEQFNVVKLKKLFDEQLRLFRMSDNLNQYAELLDYAGKIYSNYILKNQLEIWRPKAINVGSGFDYRMECLNIDIDERKLADLTLDICSFDKLPLKTKTSQGVELEIHANSVDVIYAINVLEELADLEKAMTNCLNLLKPGAKIVIEVAPINLLNRLHFDSLSKDFYEKYFSNFIENFANSHWFEYRFELASFKYLDSSKAVVNRANAKICRYVLRKIPTSAHEKTMARVVHPDFRILELDEVGKAS